MTRATVLRIVIGIVVGGAAGAALGYYGQCSGGMCPLTANPWRGLLVGAFLGLLFALSGMPRRGPAG